jgi:hypothetical protein
MRVRQHLRSFERHCLRPLGRRLKRLFGDRRRERFGLLEQRIEDLESLVRELAGLAYLRLDDDPSAATSARGAALPAAPSLTLAVEDPPREAA